LGDSEHVEELTPKLAGLEVFGRLSNNGPKIQIQIPPNDDDIIILRRTAGACNFGMSYKIFK
jgi:hypothetical protein